MADTMTKLVQRSCSDSIRVEILLVQLSLEPQMATTLTDQVSINPPKLVGKLSGLL